MDVRMSSRLNLIIIISMLATCGYVLAMLLTDFTVKVPYINVLSNGNINANMPKNEDILYTTAVSYSDSSQKYRFEEKDIIRNFHINNNGSDVLVFLRIQKTGSGTLSKHLKRDIDVSSYCNCSHPTECLCYHEWMHNVLFAYYKGFPCGLHADWTVMHTCVERTMNRRHQTKIQQRHLYFTMVREPLRRYLSERMNVNAGATWKDAPLVCGGRSATLAEVPPCYKTFNWAGVSLKEFMNCSSNLAINRQTRMLADLTLVNCYNTSGMSYEDRHYKMLKSAQENLKSMAFFGLTGHQELSQILFEKTFNFKFRTTFITSSQKAQKSITNVTAETKKDILYLNRFDVMLYKFAKKLFNERSLKLIDTTKDIQLKKRLKLLVKKLVT